MLCLFQNTHHQLRTWKLKRWWETQRRSKGQEHKKAWRHWLGMSKNNIGAPRIPLPSPEPNQGSPPQISISTAHQHIHTYPLRHSLTYTHPDTIQLANKWQYANYQKPQRSASVQSPNKQGTILQVATDGLASLLTMDTNEICHN